MQHGKSISGKRFRRLFSRAVPACALGLSILSLQGCSVIGGIVGRNMDEQEVRTKIIPVSDAASLHKGAMVYLTIPERETLKGRFESLSEQNGKRYIHLRIPDGQVRIGLGDVSEIAEDYRDNDKMVKGILIGGAVDLVIVGGSLWIYHEIEKRMVLVY
jgi:hypothetical protein